jgi:putative nucleotidyltransferase with HDIG domain
MTRDEAYALLKEKVKTPNLVKHCLAVEACMRAVGAELEAEEESWADEDGLWPMAGLLHDLDYEETVDDFERHGLLTCEYLEDCRFPDEFYDAIKAHAYKKEPVSDFEIALYAVDPLTGLIVAAALMHPDKKLASLDTDFVMRRFGEKRFAAGANRDQIRACEKLGIELPRFVGVCLGAMQGISDELGL